MNQELEELVLAIDQGTSSTKACLYRPPGELLTSASIQVRRVSSEPGAVEQDPYEIVESCRLAVAKAISAAHVDARAVVGVGLANQGESFVLFDGRGDAIGAVVGWQDTRCGDVLERIKNEALESHILARTGLPLHAEFTAPKLAFRLASSTMPVAARFGTLDTWLIHSLSPERPHITDRATASRTMLIGLEDSEWSQDLLDAFGVDRKIMPLIVPCDRPGTTLFLAGRDIPLLGSAYDMGLALLGHGCFAAGTAKATFGTCLGVMASTGWELTRAPGLLSTIPYSRGNRTAFALDGEIASAGSLVAWAIGMGIAKDLDELDRLAASARDTAGAVVVPAFNGLGAPHWRHDARGAVLGLTEAVGRPELARAVLDAIAWSLRDVLQALDAGGITINELRVDGGLTHSTTLMRRCADVCRIPLVIGAQQEATAYGAAALVMLTLGLATEADIVEATRGTGRFEPGAAPSDSEAERWHMAIESTLAGPLVPKGAR